MSAAWRSNRSDACAIEFEAGLRQPQEVARTPKPLFEPGFVYIGGFIPAARQTQARQTEVGPRLIPRGRNEHVLGWIFQL